MPSGHRGRACRPDGEVAACRPGAEVTCVGSRNDRFGAYRRSGSGADRTIDRTRRAVRVVDGRHPWHGSGRGGAGAAGHRQDRRRVGPAGRGHGRWHPTPRGPRNRVGPWTDRSAPSGSCSPAARTVRPSSIRSVRPMLHRPATSRCCESSSTSRHVLPNGQPLVLLVDDCHWLDGPSLRYLAYLAAKIAELPVLLVLATRPDAGPLRQPIIDEILSGPSVELLRPTTLEPGCVRPHADDAAGPPPGGRVHRRSAFARRPAIRCSSASWRRRWSRPGSRRSPPMPRGWPGSAGTR